MYDWLGNNSQKIILFNLERNETLLYEHYKNSEGLNWIMPGKFKPRQGNRWCPSNHSVFCRRYFAVNKGWMSQARVRNTSEEPLFHHMYSALKGTSPTVNAKPEVDRARPQRDRNPRFKLKITTLVWISDYQRAPGWSNFNEHQSYEW